MQVVPYYPPALSAGGPPKVFFDLAREFVKRGHAVTVYTTDLQSLAEWQARVPAGTEEIEGICVRRFRRARWAYRLPTKYFKFMISGISRPCLDSVKDFDIVHISEITHPLAGKFASAARKNGVPYALSVFGNLTPVKNIALRAARGIFDASRGRKILYRAAVLLVQTPHEGEMCARFTTSDKIKTMLLPVDMTFFQDLPPRGRFREKHAIGEKERVILFLGRLHPYKGIRTLINAAAELLKKPGGQYRLVIAGTDEGSKKDLVNRIKALGIESRVIFTGSIFGRDKLEAYCDADVFVLVPDTYEETSLAALEAGACGLPVIISARNAVPGLEEYQAGFQADNEAQLKNALNTILANESLRKEMGANARRLIGERYALNKVADNLETLFLELAGKSREKAA